MVFNGRDVLGSKEQFVTNFADIFLPSGRTNVEELLIWLNGRFWITEHFEQSKGNLLPLSYIKDKSAVESLKLLGQMSFVQYILARQMTEFVLRFEKFCAILRQIKNANTLFAVS